MYHARRTELEPPRRVLIIGSPGADKRQLGHDMAERLRLPVIELESLYWRPGHVRPSEDEWKAQVAELASREEWIIVGTFPATLDIRVARADWLIFVDAPMPVCFVRKLREMINSQPKPASRVHRFDVRLLRFVWAFPTTILPRIHSIIARERRNRSIFILRTRREREEFLARVPILGDMGRGVSGEPPTQ